MRIRIVPDDEGGITLAQARRDLRAQLDEGAECPCCGQFAKVYRRKIHSTMARALIRMHRAGDEWVHLATLAGPACEGGKLRYWGLVQEEGTARPDGGRSGWWRVTARGRLFVRGTISVPKYAYVYDSTCLRLDGPPVTIKDALGDRFDYSKLMRGE